MINYGTVAEKIFAIIKGHGFNLSMFTIDGMDTSEPEEGRRFYVKDPNFMITLDEDNDEIKINKNSNVSLAEMESIMTQIKNLARSNMLNTQVKVFGKEIAPKDFAYQAKKYRKKDMSDMNEASLSRMHGSKKTSYQTLESVKLIVRHRRVVDENVRGSRSRQIKAIFLEQGGERFRFPHNNLAGARAMARHMYEGGNMRDTIGEYIIESVSNIIKLAEFVRYTRTNKLINETSEDIIKIVKENIFTLRNELKRLTGVKSYGTMSEAIVAREERVLEEDDSVDLQDIFTVHKFDEKIGDMLPLVRRLMNEKAAWRAALLETSKQQVFMKVKEELVEEDIMEFDNPLQQVGYKIGKIAKRMVETGDLSKFVSRVANKLIEGETINDFEKTIVRNVMENAVIKEEDKCKECDCSPCVCDENNDTLESIGNQFELKMKMIEHEEIFERPQADYKSERNAKRFATLMFRVAKHIRAESKEAWDPESFPDDAEMVEMYEEDAQDYEKIANLALAGKLKKATMLWSGLDTSSREQPHDVLTTPQLRFFDRFTDAHGAHWSFGTLDENVFEDDNYKDCPDCDGGYTKDGKDCKKCEGDGKIDEARWDYPKGMKGKGVGQELAVNTGATNRKARKAFRKAEKAKAHQARMRGEIDEERRGDNTFEVTNDVGKVIGEVGIDPKASPGNGPWYAINYGSGLNTVGFDFREEAEAEVRAAEYLVDESLNELRKAAGINIVKEDIENDDLLIGDELNAIIKNALAKIDPDLKIGGYGLGNNENIINVLAYGDDGPDKHMKFNKATGMFMVEARYEDKDASKLDEDDWDDEVRRGEAEAGAGMGMPMPDYADCPRCAGEGTEEAAPMDLTDRAECNLCYGTGKADYVRGSKQDPFGGNYGVDVEDYMVGDSLEGQIRR